MQCPECDTDVVEGQKFCNKCGASLAGITDATESVREQSDTAAEPAAGPSEQSDTASEPAGTSSPPPPPPPPVGAALPPPVADETHDQPAEVVDDGPLITPALDSDRVHLEGLAAAAVAADTAASGDTLQTDGAEGADVTADLEVDPGTPIGAPEHSSGPAPTEQLLIVPTSEQFGTGPDGSPALFDGSDDLGDYQPAREPFKVRLAFVFALFAGVAMAMSTVADVVDIFTTIPVDGIDQGTLLLDDFGTNIATAGFIGAGVMVAGGLVACFGLRWGAGLAGGAGLAMAGWAALVVGLIELPIEQARLITRNPTTTDTFTLTITRDLGYWLVVAVGALGLVSFLCSLTQAGRGNRGTLNPWLAAVGAVAPLVLAVGPLIPVNGAVFADNFSADGPLPPIDYLVGRLVQVGLIAVGGALGFLLVRSYGLGLAAGSVSVAVWMWISSLGELGDEPIGVADRNFDAPDTIPHGVTSVGAGLTMALLIIAVIVAITEPQRSRR